MLRILFVNVMIGSLLVASGAFAQIKPDTSGNPSANEPETSSAPGGRLGAVPGTAGTASSPGPVENQVRKGSDPMANGK